MLRSLVPSCFALAAAVVAQGERGHAAPGFEPLAATAPAAVMQDLGALPPLVVDAADPAETWVVGRGYKARIAADGLLYHALPGPTLPLQPLALALQHVQVGGTALPLRTTKRPDAGHRCVLDHGAVHEHFDLRPEGVEQSFHFASLPARGELVVRLAVQTALAAVPKDGGVRFGDGPQAVHYGSATVLDADGRQLELPSEWKDGGLQITVPASFVETASLPLVVDPLLSTPALWVAGTGAGADLSVAGPDLAFSPVTDSWLLVWQVQVASNDHDVYARRFDADWNPLGSAQGVEVTVSDWSVPKIAHLAAADEWRIVAYSRVGSGYQVNLRRWSATGAVGTPVVLGSFSGAAVPTFGPAIGGDPYQGTAPSFVCVAWPAGDAVRFRTVDRTGVLGSVQVIFGSDRIDDIAISKGNGANNWLLAWVDYAALPTVTVSHRAARIRYDGTLVAGGSGTTITLNSVSNLGPFIVGTLATSSPDHAGDFTVVFHVPLIPTLLLRKVRSTGSVMAAPPMEILLPGFGVAPVGVETDGVRTLVTRGQGNNVRGVLLACNTSVGGWRVDDQFTIAGTTPVERTVPASRFAFENTGAVTPFTLAYSQASTLASAVRIVQYGGYSPGTSYTVVPTACGVPVSLNHDGTVPALGNTVRFTLGTSYPIAGFLFGASTLLPLTGICSCSLGVDGALVIANPLVLPIPLNVNLVGATFATQGFSFQAGPCFGSASLTNTIDMTIR